MKKILMAVAALSLTLTSCTSITKTAKNMDVETGMRSCSTAELEVSELKATYTLRPIKAERRAGLRNVKNMAIRALLSEKGNADVLVAPDFIVEKHGRKVKSVTVTGYPAKYKNFKPAGAGCAR